MSLKTAKLKKEHKLFIRIKLGKPKSISNLISCSFKVYLKFEVPIMTLRFLLKNRVVAKKKWCFIKLTISGMRVREYIILKRNKNRVLAVSCIRKSDV